MATHQPFPVTVLPGIPGKPDAVLDDGQVPYPESLEDFVKVLREFGLTVEFTEPRDQRLQVGFKSLELWLPILEVSRDLLIGVEGGILVEIIKTYIKPRRGNSSPPDLAEDDTGNPSATPTAEVDILLHVDWRVTLPDGRQEQFIADGKSDDVLDSLGEFERHVRDL